MGHSFNLHKEQEVDGIASNKIESFFQKFQLGALAHRCGISKTKGVSPVKLLACLFSLPFLGLNLYRYFAADRETEFAKDAVYDFLRSSRFSWRRFLLLLSVKVCALFQSLTSEERETVLILDDSTVHKPRAKHVELLARVHDHTENRFLRGFRLFCLCWSDGASLAPLDFALLSSPN
ncbi:MAG: transposase, partial [Desulfovibrionaceae bacterium]